MDQAKFQEAFNALREEYRQNLPAKIQQLYDIWNQVDADKWNADEFVTFTRLAHSLAGSGATYGFGSVSQAARSLEVFAKQLNPEAPPNHFEHAQLATLLAQLQESALTATRTSVNEIHEREAPAAPEPSSPTRRVTLYMPPSASSRDIEMQLGYFGYDVKLCEGLPECDELVESKPLAIVLDWDFAQAKFSAAQLARLNELEKCTPRLPRLFLATASDLSARLQAARHGATAYLVKPLMMTLLTETLNAQTSQHGDDPYRILIVDDDASLAAYYATALQSAGMQTRVVLNPLDVMPPMDEFRPDLILTDLYMPHVNGLELAAVLRQQEAYVSIPIVFLSGETDVDKRLSAMLLGGDDYLLKPIEATHLISSVSSRVRRARILRALAERDSLTGLLNHTRFKEQLGIEVARAVRYNGELSFIMLDIDHFKMVNDSYGHPTGDRIIKSLARLLQQRLRKTDILGRYGGEEFGVILPETNGSDAWGVMEEIRVAFGQIRQQSDGVDFHVTVSGGIATVPPATDAAMLNELSDRALYRAKRSGRNQIVYAME